MGPRHLFLPLIASLLQLVYGQQTDITLELLQTLQNRIDAAEAANRNYQTSIDSLQTQITNLRTQEANDVTFLQNEIIQVANNLAALISRVSANEGLINELLGRVSTLETSVTAAMARITKLESVDQIWRSNFQVVNRTFKELRTKIKFVVPVFRLPVLVVRAGK